GTRAKPSSQQRQSRSLRHRQCQQCYRVHPASMSFGCCLDNVCLVALALSFLFGGVSKIGFDGWWRDIPHVGAALQSQRHNYSTEVTSETTIKISVDGL